MTVLMMQAFGDFDEPYDVNIAIGDFGKICTVQEILNNFCKQLPGCDKDIRLSVYLDEMEYSNILVNRLFDSGYFEAKHNVETFVKELTEICKHHSAYVYGNMFTRGKVSRI